MWYEERKFVKNVESECSKIEENSLWNIISTEWYEKWKKYCLYDTSEDELNKTIALTPPENLSSLTTEEIPSKIENESLISFEILGIEYDLKKDEICTTEFCMNLNAIKETLVQEKDFSIIPNKSWIYLSKIYGFDKEIRRKAISELTGSTKKDIFVETHPILLTVKATTPKFNLENEETLRNLFPKDLIIDGNTEQVFVSRKTNVYQLMHICAYVLKLSNFNDKSCKNFFFDPSKQNPETPPVRIWNQNTRDLSTLDCWDESIYIAGVCSSHHVILEQKIDPPIPAKVLETKFAWFEGELLFPFDFIIQRDLKKIYEGEDTSSSSSGSSSSDKLKKSPKSPISGSPSSKKKSSFLGFSILKKIKAKNIPLSITDGISRNPNKSSKIPGLCGLQNIGNTCFMNSSLQCLSNTVALRTYFLNQQYIPEINKTNPLGKKGKLAIEFANLLSEMWSNHKTSSYVTPYSFKKVIAQYAPQFSSAMQQDSQELLSFVLDGLHEDLSRVKKRTYVEHHDANGREDHIVANEAWANHLKRNQSIIVDLFHGQLKSSVTCPICRKMCVHFDPFMFLSVPVPQKGKDFVLSVIFFPTDKFFEIICRALEAKYSKFNLKNTTTTTTTTTTTSQQNPVASPSQETNSSFNNKTTSNVNDNSLEFWKILSELSKLKPEKYEILISKSDTVGLLKHKFCEITKYAPDRVVFGDLHTLVVNSIVDDDKLVSDCDLNNKLFIACLKPEFSKKKTYHIGGNRFISEQDVVQICVSQRKTIKRKTPTTPTSPEDAPPLFEQCGIPFFLFLPSSITGSELYSITYHLISRYSKKIVDFPPKPANLEQKTNQFSIASEPTQVFFLSCVTADGESCGNESCTQNLKKNPTKELLTKPTFECKGCHYLYKDSGLQLKNENFVSIDWVDETFFLANEAMTVVVHTSVKDIREYLKNPNLEECLKNFSETEQLDAQNEWFCPNCKKLTKAYKKIELWKTPEILIVHLKRFSSHGSRGYSTTTKINTFIDFPLDNFEVNPFLVENPKKKLKYELFAVSVHLGGLGAGHYISYSKNSFDTKWYCFNDSMVTQVSDADLSKEVKTSGAYVLFYQRKKEKSPTTIQMDG